jgi:hypothetical protein
MSITFLCPEAPTYLRPDPYDAETPERVSALPEINLSNSNATAMLSLMGLPCGRGDESGTASGEVLDTVLKALSTAEECPEARISALEPPTFSGPLAHLAVGGGFALDANSPMETAGSSLGALLRSKLAKNDAPRGPSSFDYGRRPDYVIAKVLALKELFVLAKLNGWSVSWG